MEYDRVAWEEAASYFEREVHHTCVSTVPPVLRPLFLSRVLGSLLLLRVSSQSRIPAHTGLYLIEAGRDRRDRREMSRPHDVAPAFQVSWRPAT